MKVVKEFVIERGTWFNGKDLKRNPQLSPMLKVHMGHRQYRYCCLGLHALACGIQKTELTGKYRVEEIESPEHNDFKEFWRERLSAVNIDGPHGTSYRTLAIITVNDDECITEKEREAILIGLFQVSGVTLSFTGKKYKVDPR